MMGRAGGPGGGRDPVMGGLTRVFKKKRKRRVGMIQRM